MVQIVLVTNSASGLGLTAAIRFAADAKRRYKVWALIEQGGSKKDLTERGEKYLQDTLFVKTFEPTDLESVDNVLAEIQEQDGPVDILVLTHKDAGTFGPFEQLNIGDMDTLFERNFYCPVRFIQGVIPGMKKAQSGNIIVASSASTIMGSPFNESFTCAMAGFEGFCETVARILRKFNVHITIIQTTALTSNESGKDLLSTSDDVILDKISLNADKETRNMMESRLAVLRDGLTRVGTESFEQVSGAMLEIAETDKPALRLQLTDIVKQVANEHYVDPSGPSHDSAFF